MLAVRVLHPAATHQARQGAGRLPAAAGPAELPHVLRRHGRQVVRRSALRDLRANESLSEQQVVSRWGTGRARVSTGRLSGFSGLQKARNL